MLMMLLFNSHFFLYKKKKKKSENISECDERIKFISGFSGSNGLALITENEAFLWTDGRYYI